MLNKNVTPLFLVLFLTILRFQTHGQGTFVNLNFESANVPIIPSGQAGVDVAVSDGIPGWLAFHGSNQTLQMLHNDISIFSVQVGILGPNWNNTFGIPVIEGNYSAVIQAGSDSLTPVPAAISQTGLISATAKSIQLKVQSVFANPASQFNVTIAGLNIALLPLSSNSSYTLYAGDISAFAGQTRELRISALPTTYAYSSFVLDSIVFSDQTIPEPSTLGLLGLGALLFGWRFGRGTSAPPTSPTPRTPRSL